MELYEMLHQRFSSNAALEELLASYKSKPAVFYQRPPTADDPGWGEYQYPRIDYIVDMQENPARNSNGMLTVNVWCDTQIGAEPEDIESRVRGLLHAAFVQTDDDLYAFAWVRSDAFEVKNQNEMTVRTIGVTVTFDIIAYPSQTTFEPDPISAMNAWTKTVLPTATVIGLDAIDGWLLPTRENPVIYWRLASIGARERHFTHTWMNVSLEGYVCASTAADRLHSLAKINTAQALAGHIPMSDGSPLFLDAYACKAHLNYLTTGQIQASGRFGILQPESHLSNRATGSKLNNINLPHEIVEGTQTVEIQPVPKDYSIEPPVAGEIRAGQTDRP